VTGYRGWLLADTEAQKRELLKVAIELHRYAGTPFAIEKALQSVGFIGATIIENPVALFRYDGLFNYDGDQEAIALNNYFHYDGLGLSEPIFTYDGTYTYQQTPSAPNTYGENPTNFVYDGRFFYNGIGSGSRLYYTFKVNLNIGDKAITATQIELILMLIKEWKNTRSQLLDLFLTATPEASVEIADPLQLTLQTNLVYYSLPGVRCAGEFSYDGSQFYESRSFVSYNGQFNYNGEISGAVETL
jgi:P2-related tail formation protein